MALFIPNVNDVLELRIACTQNGQWAINVVHFLVTAKVGGGATLADLVGAVNSSLIGKIEDCLCNAATYHGSALRRIFPGPPTIAEAAYSDSTGAAGADPQPDQVSSLVTWRTAFAGRKYRGRIYIPFPPKQVVSALGICTAGHIAKLAIVAATLLNGYTVTPAVGVSTTIKPVVYHRQDHTWDLMTNYTVRGAFATQRRRSQLGGGDGEPF